MRKSNNLIWLIVLASIGGLTMIFTPWRIPLNGRKYAKLLRQTELKNGIPKNLLARVAYQESRFREDIINGDTISSANAQGIMQLVPKWHPNVNPLVPDDAIPYAGKYLAKLYQRFGRWSDALAAYNWGEGNLSKWLKGGNTKMPKETKDYVTQIMTDIFTI